jgi:hypothetical protein
VAWPVYAFPPHAVLISPEDRRDASFKHKHIRARGVHGRDSAVCDSLPYLGARRGFFQEYVHQTEATRTKQGYKKIIAICDLARKDGYRHAWVDTCCIDKSSSAELSEAINSMFTWCWDACVCYAYLSDLMPVRHSDDEPKDNDSETTRIKHSQGYELRMYALEKCR